MQTINLITNVGTLELIPNGEMLYIDTNTGDHIIDTWGEIQEIVKRYNETKETEFFDCHFFINKESGLVFISECTYIPPTPQSKAGKSEIETIFKDFNEVF